MRKWLQNEHVVLTGASGGIGRELCKILVEAYGAKVIGVGRNEEKMQKFKAGTKKMLKGKNRIIHHSKKLKIKARKLKNANR